MDEEYDVVVCGTGLKECILSGLLTCEGYKVLHLDRNSYYGGESASLNLTNIFKKFGKTNVPENLGANREWNIDLIPKFLMANGLLVKCLLKTRASLYLEWVVVDGTYVYQHHKSSLFTSEKHIHKVPSTPSEAWSSPLIGILEKKRCMSFLHFCAAYDSSKPETYAPYDLDNTTMREVYKSFGLQEGTIEFVGHTVALYQSEGYMDKPCRETFDRIQLYLTSIQKHGQSPFLYPLYGLGCICEGFSRLAAVHRGVYMLNKPVKGFKYDATGRVEGVEMDDGTVVRCKNVVCDPSYMPPNEIKETQKIIRAICILSSPPPEAYTKHSCQIIIPQSRADRKHDIYITVVSSNHGVCLAGKYIAVIATVVETDEPEKEIDIALNIMGEIEHKFVHVTSYYKPINDYKTQRVFCSESFDATSHFETTMFEVLDLYEKIHGQKLDLDFEPNLDEVMD